MKRNSLRRLGAAIVMCGTVAGCGVSAPSAIITASGPASSDAAEGQFGRFAKLYKDALVADPTMPAGAMLDAGLTLVDVNCQDFFRKRGQTQTTLLFLRDTLAAAVPLATGAIAIAGSGGSLTPILALSQSGATGAINVAAANFLFGADNIDDVRKLTMGALATHASTVKALRDKNLKDATFDWAVSQITDAQEICQPPNILAMSKEAISRGNVVASTSASNGKLDDKKETPAGAAPAAAPAAAATSTAKAAPLATAPQALMPSRVLVRISP